MELQLRLVSRAIALDSIVVSASVRDPLMERKGYYQRQRAGWGLQLEGRDLVRPVVTDILPEVPGVEVSSGSVRMQQLLTPNQVRAIEVYRGGEAPAEFIPELQLPCGAILVWTKR